ncbi:MAG: type II secretion system GspH family protein [Candidatus Accumulibacter sp.]|uniref:type II secretion system protein n=1 Tax=Accumulibacter sp. TaxID=2053492 RepID=UPI0025D00708|nr:type II secretion system protein [Accumulibacter sp.]MCM8597111.1 type II secretion system GspH family protein [Accumulibacter sp.]MCM8664270.1 type II secretion system GspH family protein [Accumulibacter sp.]
MDAGRERDDMGLAARPRGDTYPLALVRHGPGFGDAAGRWDELGFRAGARQTGFTYLGLMILVAVLALATSATLTLGSIAQRREAEQRLLEVGDAYRRAIASYLNSSPAGDRRYPAALGDLLKDPRYPGVRRHLRQLYPDPITGKNEWGLDLAPGGGIMGIHSLSNAPPIKIAEFETENRMFEEKSRYSEWVFAVVPSVATVIPAAAGTVPVMGGAVPVAAGAVPGARGSTPAQAPLPSMLPDSSLFPAQNPAPVAGAGQSLP